MTSVRALEGPLAAWRSFRDIARATRTLAGAQALQWAERSRHAEAHLVWCAATAEALPVALPSRAGPRPRVVIALGSDLGLCGPLNRLLAAGCRAHELDAAPTVLRVIVGHRLASLEPLSAPIVLPTPSSLAAVETLATELGGLLERLPDPDHVELVLVLAGAVEGDGHPRVDVWRGLGLVDPLAPADRVWLARAGAPLELDPELAHAARALARHARLHAALCRALTSENEARWRTMGRAFESAQRRIAEQERRLRRLRQELITQEMLEARGG